MHCICHVKIVITVHICTVSVIFTTNKITLKFPLDSCVLSMSQILLHFGLSPSQCMPFLMGDILDISKLGISEQFLIGIQFIMSISRVLSKCHKNTSPSFKSASG